MTQNEFFNILMDGLKDFPETRLHDIISYYEYNLSLRLTAGETEEEIINDLGDPNSIVKKYRNENQDIFTDLDYSIDNTNNHIDIDNKTFNQDINANIDNKSNSLNFSDNLNINSTENNDDYKTTGKLSDFNTTDSYEHTNLDDSFYNLHSSNISSGNEECNSQSAASNIFNHSCNSGKDFTIDSGDSKNTNNSNYSLKNNFANRKFTNNPSQFSVNTILRICIIILALIIFSPVITGIIGFIIGLFGIAISIFVASIGLLIGGTFTSFIGLPNVPAFVANFPYPVIVLFSLGSISLSILLTLLFYYICKFFIRISIKFYNALRNKGGEF